MYRVARKEYTDKVYRYRLQIRAFTYVYVCVYVYVYVYTHVHAHLTYARAGFQNYAVYLLRCFGLLARAWWVCVNAQLHKDAPRWSTADVYDRDLR